MNIETRTPSSSLHWLIPNHHQLGKLFLLFGLFLILLACVELILFGNANPTNAKNFLPASILFCGFGYLYFPKEGFPKFIKALGTLTFWMLIFSLALNIYNSYFKVWALFPRIMLYITLFLVALCFIISFISLGVKKHQSSAQPSFGIPLILSSLMLLLFLPIHVFLYLLGFPFLGLDELLFSARTKEMLQSWLTVDLIRLVMIFCIISIAIAAINKGTSRSLVFSRLITPLMGLVGTAYIIVYCTRLFFVDTIFLIESITLILILLILILSSIISIMQSQERNWPQIILGIYCLAVLLIMFSYIFILMLQTDGVNINTIYYTVSVGWELLNYTSLIAVFTGLYAYYEEIFNRSYPNLIAIASSVLIVIGTAIIIIYSQFSLSILSQFNYRMSTELPNTTSTQLLGITGLALFLIGSLMTIIMIFLSDKKRVAV